MFGNHAWQSAQGRKIPLENGFQFMLFIPATATLDYITLH